VTDTPEVFSTEFPDLLERHLQHLRASAISDDVIRERAYRSVLRCGPDIEKPAPGYVVLGRYGFKQSQMILPAILMPMYGVDGTVVLHQLRPDTPRISQASGKPVKYETPAKRSMRLDVPPQCREDLDDPSVPVFITEGIKKGDALASAGACAIALLGVYNWRGTNEKGGTVALADWELVALNGRTVYICYDSDILDKPMVKQAMERLAAFLVARKAEVRVVRLPSGPKGQKVGVDDFLAQGHTLQDVINLAQKELEPVKELERVFESVLKDVRHNRMYAQITDREGNPVSAFPLTNFFAKVTHEVVRDDGVTQSRFFKVFGLCEDGSILPQRDVPAESFDSLSWITTLWGLKAIMSPKSAAVAEVRHRIKVASEGFQTLWVYCHTGWHEIGGKMVYLHQGGAIGADNVLVDLEPELVNYRLPVFEAPRNGSGEVRSEVAEALRESLGFIDVGNREVTLPLWAAMYLAPLNPILNSNFTLFLMGMSGTFKSAITALALNHYGAGWNYLHLPGNWISTSNYIEKHLYLVKDAPYVVDDFAPGASDLSTKLLEGMAERIIRSQGNRQGRGRATKDPLQGRVTMDPRGLLITSGEHLPGGESRNARIFVVEVNEGDLTRDRIMDVANDEQRRRRYSLAMTQYIGYLAGRWDELKRELPKQYQEWLREIRSGGHPRQDDAVAKLYAAVTVGLQYHMEMGTVSKKEAAQLAADALDVLQGWAHKQSERVQTLKPGRVFFMGFVTMLAAGKFCWESLYDDAEVNPRPGQTLVGWADDNFYYLNADMAYSVIRAFCATTDNPIMVPAITIWRDLRTLGISECSEGRNTYMCKVRGRVTYPIRIPRRLVENPETIERAAKELETAAV